MFNADIGFRSGLVRDMYGRADGIDGMRSVFNSDATNFGLSTRAFLERAHATFAAPFAGLYGATDTVVGRPLGAVGLHWNSSSNLTGTMAAEPTVGVASIFVGNPEALAASLGPRAISPLSFRSSVAGGELFDPAKFARIQAALERQGVTFVTGDEGARLAGALGGEALYWPAEIGKPGIMVFGPNPTRTQVVEELIHYGQHKAMGFGAVGDNIVGLEIQAQDRLLQVGPRLGWSQNELSQIERAREQWLLLQSGGR
jgi:hypothetical protein